MKHLIVFFGVLVLLSSCWKGKNNPESCNGSSTRREVKITTDSSASDIDTIPIFTTIDSLGSVEVSEVKGDTKRMEIEKKIFTLVGTVKDLDKKMDGDYHILLEDENEKQIICEAPNVGCEYVKESLFLEEFIKSRTFISKNEDDLEGRVVRITGVAFVDISHGPRKNQAENNIELHPILDITFE